MDVEFRVIPKHLFFDRAAVMGAMKNKTRRVLSYFGGLTRKVAQRSMRKRKGSSAAGTPPNAHAGDLRRHIYYAYDAQRGSVVIGPLAYGRRSDDTVLPMGGETVPSIHEYGGAAVVASKRGRRRARYRPRPYMGPAADVATDKLPQIWAD